MVMEQENKTASDMTTDMEIETETIATDVNTGTVTPENSGSKRSYGHWSHERDKAYVTAAIKYFRGSSPEHAKWTDIQDTVNKVQPDLGKLALSTVKNRKKELLDAYHKRTEGLSIHTSAESTELDNLITELIEVMQTASQKVKKDGDEKTKNHQEQEQISEEGTNTEEDLKEKDVNNSSNNDNNRASSSTAGERRSRPLDKEDEATVIKRPRSIQPAYREPPQNRMKLPPPPPTTTATTPPTQAISSDRNVQLDTLNIMHQQAATLVRIENLLLRMVNRMETNSSMTAPASGAHSASPVVHPTQQNSSINAPPTLSTMSARHIAPMPSNPPPLNIRPFIPPESSQNKSKK